MEAKEAIRIAKQHLSEVFAEEITAPPTLEEIWFDERKKDWLVTLGVRRPSNYMQRDLWSDPLGSKSRVVPDYKTVRVSAKTGKVQSVKNREDVGV